MSKTDANDSLNSSISLLEQKRQKDFLDLKQQLRLTGESMKPANLIKGAVRDITGSSQFKSMLIKAAVGLALGYITNKIITRHQRNIKNRMLGNAVQYGISFLAAKRNNLLKAAGIYMANQLIETIRQNRLRRRHLNNGQLTYEIKES